MATNASIQAILAFWFGDPAVEATDYASRRKRWFGKQDDFDAAIRQRFQPVYDQAASRELDDWQQTPAGCLALLILLDQFPRNLFRNQPQAFATDAQALEIAQQVVAQGWDHQLAPIQRIFVYLPFEHSEDRQCQQRSVALFDQLQTAAPELADTYDYAVRHQVVVERFGRFPHRNLILGRPSTPEEAEFLTQPGSSF